MIKNYSHIYQAPISKFNILFSIKYIEYVYLYVYKWLPFVKDDIFYYPVADHYLKHVALSLMWQPKNIPNSNII